MNMIINTELSTDHLELIKIFLKANELVGVAVTTTNKEVRGVLHRVLRLDSTIEDTSIKFTFMGIKHAGILNMLDDYLLKCGILPDELQPGTMWRQLQNEREERENRSFMETVLGTKEIDENLNKT